MTPTSVTRCAAMRPPSGNHQKQKLPYIFKAKSISESKLGGKKACNLLKAAKHNCRSLKAESGEYGHIDPTLSHLNVFLVGPTSAVEIEAQAKNENLDPRLAGKTPRRDHCQAIELIFSLPLSFGRDVRPFFAECVKWAEKAFAGHKIYSAVIHFDEGAPHCHLLISPIRSGARVGSKVIDYPSLAVLKDKFWFEVAAPNGLAMPPPPLKGARKRKAVECVKEFLREERLPCTESRVWPVVEAAIASNPAMSLHLLNLRIG